MHGLTRLGFHVHYLRVTADRYPPADQKPPVIPPGYVVRLVTRADLLPFVDSVEGLSAAFLEDAFSSNDECAASFHGEELVGFSFTKRDRAPVTDQIDVVVPPGFRYGYKAWTHPDHRKRHLSRMMSYVMRVEGNRPHEERGISYIETHNYRSLLRSHRNITDRAIPMGYVGWFTFCGRQIPWNSRKAKWIGCIFVRREDRRVRQICW